TPFQVATQLGGGLAEAALVARVNGTLQDLDRPLESDADLELLDFSTPEGRAAFWQSSACVLGAVVEQFYGATLCSAQATEDGFFCDVHMGERTVQRSELPALEDACDTFARTGHRFERLEATRQQLAKLFKVRPQACPLPGIDGAVVSPHTSVHPCRCGPLLQLCRGPLLRHTGLIVALRILTSEYRARGFCEVVTPNVFSPQLWELSGHWQHYSTHMFSFTAGTETLSLKPMNSAARLADFGVLHRNEPPGTLTGLTRVRRFQQDDAHIFCTLEQLEGEIDACLDFVRTVYATLGFSFRLALATRPPGFLGDPETWDRAEQQLERSLRAFGQPWELSLGDGAFYGPKIDIRIRDALGRQHQCGTIQLDFQMPERFELEYASATGGVVRPVLIHRAVLGSVERMVAVLAESCGGRCPPCKKSLTLGLQKGHPPIPNPHPGNTHPNSPGSLHPQFLRGGGMMADLDGDAGATLARKIRRAQLAHYNFQLVVGRREWAHGTVSVRTRDNRQLGERDLHWVLQRLRELRDTRVPDAEERF
uniref:threonine--tRNA ligase n=1 Tax=Buteo japonicus TaxID=224669 RepID=A0A8C0HEY3_9AVES